MLKQLLVILSLVGACHGAMAATSLNSDQPAPMRWILMLYWVNNGEPILTHLVFSSGDQCQKRIQTMQKVFKVMNNDQYLMQCQPEQETQADSDG